MRIYGHMAVNLYTRTNTNYENMDMYYLRMALR